MLLVCVKFKRSVCLMNRRPKKDRMKEKFHLLLRRLLKEGRSKDVTVVTPADTKDLNLDAKDLPASLMNEIVVLEILTLFLTGHAWKILKASLLKRKKIWNCPVCLQNAPI